jgi:hypothetical protein
MPINLLGPDLAVSLPLDAHAPRAARYHVSHVDRPSPDLRDAVVLLTSELVTRAVEHCPLEDAKLELRAWMPPDVVRVEVRAPRMSLDLEPETDGPAYDLLIFGRVADRWSIDDEGDVTSLWFEVDRDPASHLV